MKTLIRKFSRTAITVVLVILAFIAIFNAWVYYTESPWTRDARFSADVVAIAPDVSGLITQVNVHDNQLVKKGQVLFVIDPVQYESAARAAKAAVATAKANVSIIRYWHRRNARRPDVVTVSVCRRCLAKRSTRRTTYYKQFCIS